MAHGPSLIFDKSSLETLNLDGAVPLDNFYPMGEKQNQPLQLSFNASLKVDFQGSRLRHERLS